MGLQDLTAASVNKAIAEFDEIGRDAFLRKYGFRPGRGGHIWHDGVAYDAKAVCAAAHGKLGRGFTSLSPSNLGTGDKAVTRRLTALGFEIVGPFHLSVVGDDGSPLDSSCELHRRGSGFTLTLHSRGGTKGRPGARNPDYLEALELVIGRLCSLGATLDGVILDTSETRHHPEAVRRLIPDCPKVLRPSTGVKPVVSMITKAAAAFNGPTAAKGGNPTKQVQIRFSAPDLRDIDDAREKVVVGGRRLFVLTWGRARNGIDSDEVRHRIETTATGGVVSDSWSTGNRKTGIVPGDHLVLLRRGSDRGIVAHGIATTGIYLDARHGDTRSKANVVGLVWDSWVPLDDRLTVDVLKRIARSTDWDSMQGSGIQVRGADAIAVLAAWGQTSPGGPMALNGDEVVGGLPEGARKTVTVNRYERNREARAQCLAAHGYACKVCDIDFGRDYGGIADGYIHVHHIVPIASVGKQYKLNPLTDLVPVCPNCHAMLHHGVKEPRTVAELRRILARTS